MFTIFLCKISERESHVTSTLHLATAVLRAVRAEQPDGRVQGVHDQLHVPQERQDGGAARRARQGLALRLHLQGHLPSEGGRLLREL